MPRMVPTSWRTIGEALPNGSGTSAVRKIVHFGGENIGGNVAVVGIWAVAAVALATVGATPLHRHKNPSAGLTVILKSRSGRWVRASSPRRPPLGRAATVIGAAG